MKQQRLKNRFKIGMLVFVLVFETAFAGYVPAYAASVSENTVISESNVSIDMTITEESTENEKETEPFTGASGESGDLTWNITADGHMTVTGQGKYKTNGSVPGWYDYKDYVKSATVKISDITDTSYMFMDFSNLLSVDLKNLDTSAVTNMAGMFYNCRKVENIDISNFDTSSVIDMSNMFENCNAIKELNIQSFDTTNVKDMSEMFYACHELENIIWNPSTFVTDNVTDMNHMFGNCHKLEKIELQGFNTSNVTNMNHMFTGCFVLQKLDLTTFNTKKVTDMGGMFSACYDLTSLDLSNFDTGHVSNMEDMFYGCDSLLELDLSNFDTTNYIQDSVFSVKMFDLQKFVSGKDKRTYKLVTNATKWFDDFGNQYEDNTEIELEPNTTLYALFNKYNIKYIYDGDLYNASLYYRSTENHRLYGYVKKDHYTFDGWYTDAKYTKKITEINAGTYGDITLYAKMIPDTYSITYKNVEDILNAEQLTTSYAYGIEMTPVVPTKTCFLFDGWYLDEALTKVFTGISQATSGDLELYAKWKENHDLDKENGVVIKEATTISEGEIQYKCKNCTYTETEKIPRIVTQESQITDETILNNPDEGDIKGSDFTKFQARADKTTKNSIRLKWNKIKEADGYKIYGNKCGKKNQYELITDLKGSKKTTWTQKKRKKGTYYKYIVRAYKVVDGQEITLAISKTIHATTTGGKSGNAKSVNIKTDKKCKKTKTGYTLTLKKGKTYKLKATEVAGSKKISIHRKIRFDSTNKEVATVSKGVVKAKAKGTCYIYAYAQNGVYKKIKVVVK